MKRPWDDVAALFEAAAVLSREKRALVAVGGTGGTRARSCRELLLSSYEALGLDLPAAALREQIAAQTKGS